VTNDIDTLATAPYARTDDLLKQYPELAPWRPATGLQPRLTDAELVTLAVMQALLGCPSEARWIRHAHAHLLAADTSLWADDMRVVDSTPVECGRSRETAKRSDLAGWAEYGYCASHSRYFWGLRLHLLCTLSGLPAGFALTGAKADERQVLMDILADPVLTAGRARQIIIGDKNYYGHSFEATLADGRICLLRPAREGESERPGSRFFKPLRQVIESVSDTFKGQLDLERHGGHTPAGVLVKVLQRILALTTAIWHNDHTSQPIKRSLPAYDH
jgi:hypothetical protein